ncbi:MAG: class I SAM-dependent methyltransferase [Spirochaetales bacterium]|nr:class I SAM-dependent methyltransferase [Spirochaetales bacterium]
MNKKIDIVAYNQRAWNHEVESGNPWTLPASPEEIQQARSGNVQIVLTPKKGVPHEWLGRLEGRNILCLACGGGQQGPLLAAAGAQVTVFDNSESQLQQDISTAERENLTLKTVQGSMKDLSCFEDTSFDLIFHPVSNCFVDEIQPVWNECFRVLRSGGVLLAGFCNPLTFIFDMKEWEEHNRLKLAYSIPFSDVEQLSDELLDELIRKKQPLEFGHSLEAQIGGQISAGFSINGFYEDYAGDEIIDKHIMTFAATMAKKLDNSTV